MIRSQAKEDLVIFPSPPDTTRIQFLTRFSASADITGKRSPLKRYVLGEDESQPIVKPYGITIKKQKLYICDTMLPGIAIIDPVNHVFEYFRPGGLGELKKPINCVLDDRGFLYVADAERGQIVIFDDQRQYRSVISFGEESKPTDVVIIGDTLYICDLAAHQVRVFDINHEKSLFSFPELNQNLTQYLFSPTNITTDGISIYISDTGDAQVKVFNRDGTFVRKVGGFGKRHGQFVRPKGLAIDDSNLLYVVDAAFENVQIFNDRGNALMPFGGSYKGPGYMYLPADVITDKSLIPYFQKYVHPGFDLEYLIFVTNQYGPDKVTVYGFVTANGN